MKVTNLLLLFLVVIFSCNNAPAQTPELKASMVRGAAVYEDFCMSCHLPDGKGVPEVYPPLADSDYLMKKRLESIKAVKYGLSGEITVNGVKYNSVMAALGLYDDEVADVMNYILNSWGNEDGKMVTVDEVSKIEP
ncbi:c-type cytochrome [Gelidibacter maritimus]|uniref:Cytochrome c n=1 Tax=Gelidibacter maritimus TaxID=2761487 RepID=A0A7W2M553_9FLAO|nr:cytochrome c [Gelidibacter maritimus]MBA6152646.1 cytochrome c [Gelidibacter maritimus]